MRVAWLGLGAMGDPMARRLAGTVDEVVAFDVVADRAAALSDAGVRAAGSPAEAASSADVVFVMVASPDQAMDALFGEEGAAAAIPEGAAVVVTSTVGPAAVLEIEARLARVGVRVLDAPVSGGVARARTGELVIMVGGAMDLFEAVQPILDRLGANVTRVGDTVGDGQSVKLVNQLLCGVHIAAAAEALGFAASLGLDPKAVWEVIRHGAAGSFMLNDRGGRMLDHGYEPVRSALSIFVKDMGLVVDAAKKHHFPTPLASAAEQLYLMGAGSGLARLDDASVVTLYERWAGREVTAAP